MDHSPLESSHLASCGYDPATRTLEVAFHRGHCYQYQDVSAEEYESLRTAYSPGTYFRETIRPRGGQLTKPESL